MAVTSATSTGINVPEIVSGLMEVERAPVSKLEAQIDQKTLVISTLGVFKSKVAALESASKAIETAGVFSLRSTSSSDATKVSATASNSATTGAYTVKVAQTAQSETSMIGGFASGSQVVNLSGFSLTTKQGTAAPVVYSPSYAKIDQASFSSGEKIVFTLKGGAEQSFSVTTQTTPAAVASAINSAVTSGTLVGVTASVDADGDLQLSSSNPLQGLTAGVQTPGYAKFGAATAFASGDILKFTVSGGSEQRFVITTQDTAAKVAAAVNTSVSAGALSGVSASVTGAGELKITSTEPTKSVSAVSGATSATSTAAASGTVTTVSTGLSTTATVSNVVTWINALDADLGATLVQRADGKMALNVSATETGAANAFSISGISTSDAQKDKITLSGTFAVDDAIVLNVNGEPLIYKVTANNLTADNAGGAAVAGNSATAYANIATSIAAAYNASLSVNHTPVTATAETGTITLVADSAGTAFTTTSQVSKKLSTTWTSVANASGVAQIDELQISGKYAAGDVVSVTVNGVAVSHTIASGDVADGGSSAADYGRIATALAAAYTSSGNAAHTPTALASGSVITFTAAAPGTAFTTSSSVTPAGPLAIRAVSVANSTSPATAQVDTVALSGKYTAGDTLSVTVSGVALSYTVTAADVTGGGSAAADHERIAQGFVSAYNASTNAAHTPVTASYSGGVISLTADTAGTGFTATVSASSAAVATGAATRSSVVANVSDRGITGVGAGTVTGAVADGTYNATYDGAAWIVQAPSSTFTASLVAGTLTLASGGASLSVASVTGTPKAGDRISVVVSGSGTAAAATISEHNAIELQSSRDAFFSINGTAVQRTTNQVDDVISGVTFNLNAPVVPAGGAVSSLSSVDFSSATSTVINVASGAEDLSAAAIEDFVTAYNDLLSFYKTESISSQDPAARGVLNGDSTLRTFMERVRSLYARGIRLADGSSISFSSIGVEVQRDGSIYLDKGKLNTAVSNGLQEKFAAGVKVGYESSTSNLTSFITASLRTTGLITSHLTDVETQQTRLEDRVEEWEDKLARIEQRYYRQYAALDALLFRLQTTSNALTSAIESLVNSQKNG
jgi:flagellar capping protein FliD